MCRGVLYIHSECQHPRKFHLTSPPCPSAPQPTNPTNTNTNTNTTTTACPTPTATHVVQISHPSLCPTCFRTRERAIDAEYETTARDLRDEVARVDCCLAGGGGGVEEGGEVRVRSAEAERSLAEYREQCVDDVRQARAARDMGIRLFREGQGVWGDG